MHAYLLLDRSGSMAGKWTEALAAINGYVTELAQATPALAVTLAAFDDPSDFSAQGPDARRDPAWFEILRDGVRAEHWRPVRPEETGPRGTTPLFDALERLVALAEAAEPDRAALVVMTDGEENASRVATQSSAKAHLDRCRARGWQVVFLGADFDTLAQATGLGATARETLTLSAGSYSAAMAAVAHSTSTYATTGTAMALVPEAHPDLATEPRSEAAQTGTFWPIGSNDREDRPMGDEDHFMRLLREGGFEPTRQRWIDMNYGITIPDPWTWEHEEELPPSLRAPYDGSELPPQPDRS